MTEQDRDSVLCTEAKRLLESDLERLPAAQLSRLRRARALALGSPSPRIHYRPFVYAASLAVMILVTIVATQMRQPEPLDGPVEMFELVATGEDLELYEELDFYLWLDQLADAG